MELNGVSVKLKNGTVEDFDVEENQFLEVHEFKNHLIIENASYSWCFEMDEIEAWKKYSNIEDRF